MKNLINRVIDTVIVILTVVALNEIPFLSDMMYELEDPYNAFAGMALIVIMLLVKDGIVSVAKTYRLAKNYLSNHSK